MNQQIKINCDTKHYLPLADLTIFQGNLKDLTKTNYDKLKNEILKNGIISPWHIWQQGEVNNILDGTQRCRTLTKMSEQGFDIPKLPVVYIEADNVKQAKEMVLSLTSQYGTLTEQGLYSFISDADITIDEVKSNFDFPDIDIEHFEASFFDADVGTKTEESVVPENTSEKKIVECPECGEKFPVDSSE